MQKQQQDHNLNGLIAKGSPGMGKNDQSQLINKYKFDQNKYKKII